MRTIDRRTFLRRGSLVAAAVMINGGSPRVLAAPDSTIEQAALAYLAARARAMDSGRATDVRDVRSRISDSNPALRDFVEFELAHLNHVIHAQPTLIGIRHDFWITAATDSSVHAYERVAHPWRNEGSSVPVGDVPPAARPTTKPVIESASGFRHRLELEPLAGSFRVRRDAFRGVAWDSPYVGQVAASPLPPTRLTASPAGPQPRTLRPLAYSYLWDYAVNYCYTYWQNYNSNYYNYNSMGGDCTSFISQALASAGWIAGNRNDPDAYWYDAAVVPWVGRAWYNNNPQKPWIINNGRGYQIATTPQDLARGDIVYYDWTPIDGTLQHTVMVTTIPASTSRRLVSGHNADINEEDWDTYWGSNLRPFQTHSMHLYPTY